MSVICHACQTDNRDTARCCTTCGAALVLNCPQCTASNKISAQFCVQCGHRFAVPADAAAPFPAPVSASAPAAALTEIPVAAAVLATEPRAEPVAAPVPEFSRISDPDLASEPASAPALAAAPPQISMPKPGSEPKAFAIREPQPSRQSEPAALFAPAPQPEPMKFMFEDALDSEFEMETRRRPVGVYVGLAAALLVAVGAAGWFIFSPPGASAAADAVPTMAATDSTAATSSASEAPSDSVAPVAADAQAAVTGATAANARQEPVEEVLESTPATSVMAAPATATPALATAATTAAIPAAIPAFTPVTVPRVRDAALEVADPAAQAPSPAQRRKSRTDDAPWPPVERAPLPQADPVARLRGALAQCAAMSNELSRGNCLARTRQNFCGDAWGRIPECPAGN